MLSVILHLLLALMLMVGLEVTYRLWQKKKFALDSVAYFFLFYLFFTGYNLSLSLPFLFYPQNLVFLAWGYNLAIVFCFLPSSLFSKWKWIFMGSARLTAVFFWGW